MSEKESGFGTWAIVELMGHVKVAGYLTEEERFGVKMGRIDIPGPDAASPGVTQYFGGSSVYRITPVSEEVARAYARERQPAPVQQWELPVLREAREEIRRLQTWIRNSGPADVGANTLVEDEREVVAHHEDDGDYYGDDF